MSGNSVDDYQIVYVITCKVNHYSFFIALLILADQIPPYSTVFFYTPPEELSKGKVSKMH